MFARTPHHAPCLFAAAAAVTLLSLAGLAGAQPVDQPLPPPDDPVAPADTTAVATAALPVYTLRDCARMAIEGSLQVLIASEQIEIAEQDVKAAKGAFLPDLSANASYSKSNRTDYDVTDIVYGDSTFTIVDSDGDLVPLPTQVPVGEVTDDVEIRSTSKALRANGSLTLFDGLANVNNLKAANASREAAVASEEYSRALILQNVGVAYYNLLRALALRDVKVEDRDRAAMELERTETYFRLGSAARADVLQQKVRLENTRLALVIADNAIEQAFADLAHAMNRPLARRFDIDRSSLDTDMTIEDVDALYAEAIANRADLRASEYNTVAREKTAAAATGPLLPQVDIFGSFNRSNDESPYRFGSQTSQSFAWGGQVSLAIFDRYQSWARRAQAKAQARIADYDLQQAQLDAQLEVRRYHISMGEAKERLAVSRETVIASEEDLRLARERFRVGAGTQLDRIAAEVALAQAQAGEVEAICDFLIARLQLYRAVGRLDGTRMLQP
jgi:outer membrane protein TolC